MTIHNTLLNTSKKTKTTTTSSTTILFFQEKVGRPNSFSCRPKHFGNTRRSPGLWIWKTTKETGARVKEKVAACCRCMWMMQVFAALRGWDPKFYRNPRTFFKTASVILRPKRYEANRKTRRKTTKGADQAILKRRKQKLELWNTAQTPITTSGSSEGYRYINCGRRVTVTGLK